MFEDLERDSQAKRGIQSSRDAMRPQPTTDHFMSDLIFPLSLIFSSHSSLRVTAVHKLEKKTNLYDERLDSTRESAQHTRALKTYLRNNHHRKLSGLPTLHQTLAWRRDQRTEIDVSRHPKGHHCSGHVLNSLFA